MLLTEKAVLFKIKELENDDYIWEPLGGIPNNEGLVHMLTEPIAGLTERITNAIDAVLEKYYIFLNSSAQNLNELVNEIQSYDKNNLEDFVSVSIHNSESKDPDKSISIEISDKGIGINGNEFEKTILKLNGDNKLSKKYLMGAYGQGGSTSIKFNEFTVIYSRTKTEEVMTILRYNLGTNEVKNGRYEYIVKKINGTSFFASSSVLKETGTKIINVSTYHKKHKTRKNYPYHQKIYKLLTNNLFCPPLPFALFDKQKNNNKNKKKIIIGARKKLDKKINDPEYFDEKIIITKQGSAITLRWWVIMPDPKDKSKNLLELYLKNARLPFNVTMNGQTHGHISAILLDEIEFSFLKKHFVCEIDLTNITKKEKQSILSSSREKISKNSALLKDINPKITKYFLECQKLQNINKEIKKMMNSNILDDKFFNEELKKALKSFIPKFAKDNNQLSQKKSHLNSIENKEKQKNDIILKDWPSYFRFKGTQPIKFSGDTLKIRYVTDGKPDVILQGIKIINIPESLKLIDIKQKEANGVILFDATNAPTKINLKITFNILQWLFIKNVIVNKNDILDKPKKLSYPKPNIIFLHNENDGNYARLNFNEKIPCVVEYYKLKSTLSIYINFSNYSHIEKYQKKYYEKDETMLDKFKHYYALGLSLYTISKIQKYDHENIEIDETYDYNPIAKNLIWSFNDEQKIK